MPETPKQVRTSRWIAWMQQRALVVRILLLSVIGLAIVALLFMGTALLYFQNIRSMPRPVPAALPAAGVTVTEFVQFDAADAYPASVAVAADGTLYTASYLTGAVWRIAPDGNVQSITDSAAHIGSVMGLEVDNNGILYVLDRVDPLQAAGAVIWRITADTIEQVLTLPAQGQHVIGIPAALAADTTGHLYVADMQYDRSRATGRILRITLASGAIDDWWELPAAPGEKPAAPAGLAYDALNNALLVTDAAHDAIYRIPLSNPNAPAETLYAFNDSTPDRPGLNGITVADDGTIYVAALGLNRAARLEDGALVYLAAGFRGASDIAYDAHAQRLFVNNWDQRWLLPVNFLFISQQFAPRLPFSIDVIQL
jgi:sugar lactone lactonase YvrE